MWLRSLLFIAFTCFTFLIPYLAEARDGKLQFITNRRQWPAQVRYKADLQGGSVFLTSTGFTYSYYSLPDVLRIHDLRHKEEEVHSNGTYESVRCHAYSVNLLHCNEASQSRPGHKLHNYYNYFLGNDTSQWAAGMAAYEEVSYPDIYPRVGLHVYSQGTALKYDFVVGRGGRVQDIQMVFDGVKPTLTRSGDLLIKTSVNELLEKAPYAYQIIKGRKQTVACRYQLNNGIVSFSFPNGYDHNRQLVIDPVLVFATYSGSTSTTFGWSATYDTSGNLYAGGESFGTGWPVSLGAFQTTFGGTVDVGINKYSSNGTSLIYSTYYGGSNADFPNSMTVNSAGELVLAGATLSPDLAVTSGCFDNTYNGGLDVYVAHFNASGTALAGATYLGGSGSEGNTSTSLGLLANRGEVVTDAVNNIYVSFGTTSANYPTTTGAFQTSLSGSMDAFVSKLNPSCSGLLLSTYLGGSGADAAITMQLSSSGNIVVGGGTTSTNFPGTSSGWQSSLQGSTDGFVAILNAAGNTLLYATYVGTTGNDDVSKLSIDAAGNIYATGINSTGAFPVSPGTYSAPNGPDYIAKFNPTLSSRLVSTTISTPLWQLTPTAFMVDNCGYVYFVGYAAVPSGLPTTPNAFQTTLQASGWACSTRMCNRYTMHPILAISAIISMAAPAD